MKNLDKTLWIKRIFMVLMDICIVILTSITALIVRFEFSLSAVPKYYIGVVWSSLPATLVIAIIVFYVFRLYSSLWVYAGVTELLYLAAACIVDTLLNTVTILLNYRDQEYPLPRSWYFIYGTLLLAFMFISRYSYRAVRTFFGKKVDEKNLKRVLVVGAGEAGNSIIKEISGSRFVNMHIVGFVDDDKSKIGKYMHGVKVLGDRNDIIEIANEYLVDEIIIAIPTASAKETKAILDICKQTGCELKRLPGMYQLVNGDVSISKLKDVDVNDLLGRDPITVDLDSIMGYVSDKVVMVTGGGGSIGSELCRQIASHNPKQLVIVDIYENTTYDIQQELKRNYPELDLVVLIASVRNTKRMDLIFDKYRPEIVYHAAAHKHVPLMEDSPNEAVKNNVLGTWKVVQAADKYNVKRFVMISTDKAVNPTNIMGATKRICEMIIQTYNNRSKTEYVAVRFGNVLGSNGSVIPLFKKQIEAGGPVTVTHPDIIRYFMTIPEAVSLVLQAGAYAKGGEIFVLDMGEPVKIVDLARNLILLSGHKPDEDIQIVFTGLRPGEKLYEEMLMKEEGMQETANKLIHIGKPIQMDEEKFLKQLEEIKEHVVEEPDDMLAKAIVPLDEKETGGSLFDKLSEAGGRLCVETLAKLEKGEIIPEKQGESPTAYASMLDKKMGNIDWNKSAVVIERLVRGLNPWPSAYTHLDGKTLKIWACDVLPQSASKGESGEILEVTKDAIHVQTGDGILVLREIQLAGKARMDAGAFLRGYKVVPGTVLSAE